MNVTCPHCNGTGVEHNPDYPPCSWCEGNGVVAYTHDDAMRDLNTTRYDRSKIGMEAMFAVAAYIERLERENERRGIGDGDIIAVLDERDRLREELLILQDAADYEQSEFVIAIDEILNAADGGYLDEKVIQYYRDFIKPYSELLE